MAESTSEYVRRRNIELLIEMIYNEHDRMRRAALVSRLAEAESRTPPAGCGRGA